MVDLSYEILPNQEHEFPSRFMVRCHCSICKNDFDIRIAIAKVQQKNGYFRCHTCKQFPFFSGALNESELLTIIDEHTLRGINSVQYDLTLKKYGYDLRKIIVSTKKRAILKCDFCMQDYDTIISMIKKDGSPHACKKCDALCSVYVKDKREMDPHEFFCSRMSPVDDSAYDNEATLEKFGYHPSSISKNSAKKVVAKCRWCGVHCIIPNSKYSRRNGIISCWPCVPKKTQQTLKSKYGVTCTLDIPEVNAKLCNPSTERLVESVLQTRYKVSFTRSYTVGPYSFDFFLPDLNLLLECQGDSFHDFKNQGYSGTPKDRSKSSYIESNTSLKLVWIYEHELHLGRINKILDYHIHKVSEPELSVDKKKVTFKRISDAEAHSFLAQYHYLGNLGGVSVSYGAFLGDFLLAVCVYGGVTRNQTIKKTNEFYKENAGPSEIRELRRFCIRPGLMVKNFASFLLPRFSKTFKSEFSKIRILVSFADSSVGDTGVIYKANNWDLLKSTTESYHYLDTVNNKMVHKKTVWDAAKLNHMKEADFAKQSGLVQVTESSKFMYAKKI